LLVLATQEATFYQEDTTSSAAMAVYTSPGRLGDPNMTLSTEPRLHAGLLQALKQLKIHEPAYLTSDITVDAPLEDIRLVVEENEKSLDGLLRAMDYSSHLTSRMVASYSIEKVENTVPTTDGRHVRLTIRRPQKIATNPVPAVVHFHSGGMVILGTDNPMHVTWNEELTRTGLITIAVDFRNAIMPGSYNPFPAGLEDCASAVRWVHAHRKELGISKIVLQGESGGGNLALAVALKALKEGWVDSIDGVCATQPYISGAYGMPRDWKLQELPSLVECDGYLISCVTSALNVRLYDPTGEHSKNPLAWPYWASTKEMMGLPPHLIITNELDPLRDEGNVYYRKLVKAQVRAVAKMNMGVVHEAELFLRQTLPDMFISHLSEVKAFVEAV
jgi:acetyl esterase